MPDTRLLLDGAELDPLLAQAKELGGKVVKVERVRRGMGPFASLRYEVTVQAPGLDAAELQYAVGATSADARPAVLAGGSTAAPWARAEQGAGPQHGTSRHRADGPDEGGPVGLAALLAAAEGEDESHADAQVITLPVRGGETLTEAASTGSTGSTDGTGSFDSTDGIDGTGSTGSTDSTDSAAAPGSAGPMTRDELQAMVSAARSSFARAGQGVATPLPQTSAPHGAAPGEENRTSASSATEPEPAPQSSDSGPRPWRPARLSGEEVQVRRRARSEAEGPAAYPSRMARRRAKEAAEHQRAQEEQAQQERAQQERDQERRVVPQAAHADRIPHADRVPQAQEENVSAAANATESGFARGVQQVSVDTLPLPQTPQPGDNHHDAEPQPARAGWSSASPWMQAEGSRAAQRATAAEPVPGQRAETGEDGSVFSFAALNEPPTTAAIGFAEQPQAIRAPQARSTTQPLPGAPAPAASGSVFTFAVAAEVPGRLSSAFSLADLDEGTSEHRAAEPADPGPPAPPATEPQRGARPARAAAGERGWATWRDLGVPRRFLPEDREADEAQALAHLVRELPAPPSLTVEAGRAVILAGEGALLADALQTVQRNAAAPLRTLAVGEVTTLPPGVVQVDSGEEAARLLGDRAEGEVLTLIIGPTTRRRDRRIATEVIEKVRSIAPEVTWVAVDARRRLAEWEDMLDTLPVRDPDLAMAFHVEHASRPGELLSLDLPVATLDGHRATRGLWAGLLVDSST